MSRSYPSLAEFLGAWFHQDFDVSGDSIEEIVSAFKRSAAKNDVEALQRDIRAFLDDHPNDASEQLEEVFDLEIDPLGFSTSGEMFLRTIARVLSADNSKA